jgi:hypothetical protein
MHGGLAKKHRKMTKWHITSRFIQIALGLLWLLDGFLQFQPQLFTSNFTSQVISPAAVGQPLFVAGPMHFFIYIFLFHPAIFNSFAAITQLGLGVLILMKRTVKIGLIGSMAWGLFVWAIGEGYGGIFSGHTLLLMGAPGAALLYVLLAFAVLPRSKTKDSRPPYWLTFVWAASWIGGAIYQLLPGQNTVADISSIVAGNDGGQPGWLASLDNRVANWINNFGSPMGTHGVMHMSMSQMASMQTQSYSGYWFILLLATIQLLIGLVIFLPRVYRNSAITLGIALSLMFWVVGQSFGGIFTGLATDPNAAPLFILFGLAILGCKNLSIDLQSFYKRLEQMIT